MQSPRDIPLDLITLFVSVEHSFIQTSKIGSILESWWRCSRPMYSVMADYERLESDHIEAISELVKARVAEDEGAAGLTLAKVLERHDYSIDSVLRTAESRDSPKSPGLSVQDRSGRDIGPGGTTSARFRNLQVHKSGGLGTVYTAEDVQLRRKVAVKKLKNKSGATQESMLRLEAEAEITGSLDHPGIVPVYAFGYDEKGDLYYAMRFVDGEDFETLIEAYHASRGKKSQHGDPSNLAFRRLLGSFVDACNTVDYAHKQNVIHRDLKPENMMIGPYGETLVVDWGLAKVVGRNEIPSETQDNDDPQIDNLFTNVGVDLTKLGAKLGTTVYMSPEQAEADVSKIGPASDIFGLGATLYKLLTGSAPYWGRSREEKIEKAKRCDFSKPSKKVPTIPRGLEAICLKAMERRPEDRYATAGELANQIELWLADEPLPDYRDPFTTRAARWTRRHKSLAAVSVALLFMSSVAGAAIGLIVNNSRNDALESLANSRKVIDFALKKLSDQELFHEPKIIKLREELLKMAAEELNLLVKKFPNDSDAVFDFVSTLRSLSNTMHYSGGFEGSLDVNIEEFNLFKNYYMRFPNNHDLNRDLALTFTDFGELCWGVSQFQDAISNYDISIQLLKGHYEESPENSPFIASLAYAYLMKASALSDLGKMSESAETFALAVPLFDQRATESQANPDLANELLRIQNTCSYGRVLGYLGEHERASSQFDLAVGYAEAFLMKRPKDNDAHILLAMTLNYEAEWNRSRQLPAKNDEDSLRAIKLAEDSHERDPDVLSSLFELGKAYANRAHALAASGLDRRREIEEMLNRSYEILEEVRRKCSDLPSLSMTVAQNEERLAELANDDLIAQQHRAKAEAAWLAMSKQAPGHPGLPKRFRDEKSQ